jgi:hypothetical protein
MKNMKYTINLLVIAITSIAMITACSDDKISDPSSLTVDQTEIDVLSIGGQTLINVNTDLTWNASVDADWVRIKPASGNGSEIVEVEIDKHLGVRRTAKISFTAGAITKTVDLLQRGREPIISYSPEKDLLVTNEGGVYGRMITSNLDFMIDTDVDWIRPVYDKTGGIGGGYTIIDMGDGSYMIVVENGNDNLMSTGYMSIFIDANTGSEARSGSIVFTEGDYRDTIKVSQDGVRLVDSDGYVVVNTLPFREKRTYESGAVKWQGQVGAWGEAYGVLVYKVTVTNSGKLKITDHESPDSNIWFLLYNNKESADKGDYVALIDADGTVEYDVTPGTYYVFGILNTWYEGLNRGDVDYDIEITCK